MQQGGGCAHGPTGYCTQWAERNGRGCTVGAVFRGAPGGWWPGRRDARRGGRVDGKGRVLEGGGRVCRAGQGVQDREESKARRLCEGPL